MLDLMPRRSILRQAIQGITLIEVMMSTMVVSLGILGLIALIPLGTHLTERGTRADRIASYGPRAFHEAFIREWFNPNRWVDATGAGVVFGPTGGTMPYRQPYMLDPRFFGSNGTDTSRRFFPYLKTYGIGQAIPTTDSYTTNKPVRMHRFSLRRSPGGAAMSLAQANAAFESADDLAIDIPGNGEVPSYQNFFTPLPNQPVKRQYGGEKGQYSWMIMLTPEPFELANVAATTTGLTAPDAQYLHPPIDTSGSSGGSVSKAELVNTLTNAVTDNYTAHVLIIKDRSTHMPFGPITPGSTPDDILNERVLQVTSFPVSPVGGYATGEVQLALNNTSGTITKDKDVKTYMKVTNGDWICLVRRMPVAGGSTSAFPRGDVYQWYRVITADEVVKAGGSTGPDDIYSRLITINGPDWPVNAGSPTHAIIVDGVVGVYSKRVKLETVSPWTP
ncbi:hypothetical protein GC197_00705 [bacterium]|nr:hypothetical protein [bacterium]